MTKKSKLCFLISGALTGEKGQEYFISLCQKISVLCELHVLADYSFASRFGEDITFHPVDGELRVLRSFKQVARLIQSIHPEVVHAHDQESGKTLALLSAIQKFPAIATVHQFTAIANAHEIRGKQWWMQFLDGLVCKNRQSEKSIAGMPSTTIYGGVKTRVLSYQYLLPDTSVHLVTLLDSNSVEKTEALINLCSELPVVLHVIGDVSASGQSVLSTRNLTGTNQVVFHGSKDDAPEILSACDFAVLTSNHNQDDFLFQALLLNTPVISSNEGIAAEVLDQRQQYPSGSSTLLKAQLEKAVTQPAHIRKESEAAFQLAARHFKIEKAAASTLDFYGRVIRQAGQAEDAGRVYV